LVGTHFATTLNRKDMTPFKLLIGLAAAVAGVAQAQAGVVFQDDFSANSAANWSFSGQNAGTWAVDGQKLQSSLTQTAHNPTEPGFAAINGLSTSSHFKIEADVQVVGYTPGQGTDWGHVGFFWGQTGADSSIGYLRTHLDHVTAWEYPYTGEVVTAAGFATTNAADIDGVSYHLAFEVDYVAQLMRVSVDGTSQVWGGADFDRANSPGGVGGALGVISWGEHVSYDNVVVTDYAGSSVPEPGSLALAASALGLLGAATRRRRTA
jgi:hypothetical protein